MKSRFEWLFLVVVAAMGLSVALTAWPASHSETREKFEHDRQSILAMAGTYKVTFNMRETVPFVADYQPIPAKTSIGHEVVKVIEDTGTKIGLQHLLVTTGEEGHPEVIKHWRQTWAYEPGELLVYTSANHWTMKSVPTAERRGMWSQTVWQTDDSPRYGGLGRWVYDNGVARWTSGATLRPLARRDATRHPVYDRYLGSNRHALTPSGWVHEQDNAKLGTRDGKTLTFVHEVVVNTYEHASDFEFAAADQYWDETQTYWAAVRGEWNAAVRQNRGIQVKEEAENGSSTGHALMELANRIVNKEVAPDEGVALARGEISSAQAAVKAGASL